MVFAVFSPLNLIKILTESLESIFGKPNQVIFLSIIINGVKKMSQLLYTLPSLVETCLDFRSEFVSRHFCLKLPISLQSSFEINIETNQVLNSK